MREPLPYLHTKNPADPNALYACTIGEQQGYGVRFAPGCPGCMVAMIAKAITRPSSLALREDGSIDATWQIALERLSDFDPMRVLFERALAERGIQ